MGDKKSFIVYWNSDVTGHPVFLFAKHVAVVVARRPVLRTPRPRAWLLVKDTCVVRGSRERWRGCQAIPSLVYPTSFKSSYSAAVGNAVYVRNDLNSGSHPVSSPLILRA